jgi:hypothetical protein
MGFCQRKIHGKNGFRMQTRLNCGDGCRARNHALHGADTTSSALVECTSPSNQLLHCYLEDGLQASNDARPLLVDVR